MSAVANAIRASRGALRHVESTQSWIVSAPEAAVLLNRSLVYYNGAFSPPTLAHAHIVAAIASYPGVDAVWMDPEPARPKKELWLDETFDARVEMCDRMLAELGLEDVSGVGTLRRDLGPEAGSSIDLFHTLRTLLGGVGHGRLVWALGADVLDNMRFWAEKARTFVQPGHTCDGFLVFIRDGWTEEKLREAATTVLGREPKADELILVAMPENLAAASSHKARKALVLQGAQRNTGECAPQNSTSLLLPVIENLCHTLPHVLEAYSDQVASTPDATPIVSASTDPAQAQDAFSLGFRCRE